MGSHLCDCAGQTIGDGGRFGRSKDSGKLPAVFCKNSNCSCVTGFEGSLPILGPSRPGVQLGKNGPGFDPMGTVQVLKQFSDFLVRFGFLRFLVSFISCCLIKTYFRGL